MKSDSHFDIIIKFSDGRELKNSTGYVTNGFNYIHEIIVTNSDIDLHLLDITDEENRLIIDQDFR